MNIDTYKTFDKVVNNGNEEILKVFHAAEVKEVPAALRENSFEKALKKELTAEQQADVIKNVYQFLSVKLAPFYAIYRHVLSSYRFSVDIKNSKLIVSYTLNERLQDKADAIEKDMTGIVKGYLYNNLWNKAIKVIEPLQSGHQTLTEREISCEIEQIIERKMNRTLEQLDYLRLMSQLDDEFQQTLQEEVHLYLNFMESFSTPN